MTKIERSAETRSADAKARIPVTEHLAGLTEEQCEGLRDRLWSNVAIDPRPGVLGMEVDGRWSPCWVAPHRVIGKGGHRQLRAKGRMVLVHRLAFALHHGREPQGAVMRHLCGNPACVNPEHLDEGTHVENCEDRHRHAEERAAQRNAPAVEETEDLFEDGDEASDSAALWEFLSRLHPTSSAIEKTSS